MAKKNSRKKTSASRTSASSSSSKAAGSTKASSVPEAPRAIITPIVDFLCCGGLSIVAVVVLFAGSFVFPESPLYSEGIGVREILILGYLINFPHFLASYKLLYRSKEQIKEYSWASTIIPLILLVLIIYALMTPNREATPPEFANGTIIEILSILAAMLLAWHYTGQAWGMTASFAFIGGIRMEAIERRLIRSGYHALMIFHLLWASLIALDDEKFIFFRSLFGAQRENLIWLSQTWTLVVLLTIPLGIYGFLRIWRRTGTIPPLRSYAPWIAIFFWYGLIWVYPRLFACLQIFHALQYLIFPIRVELNRTAREEPNTNPVAYAALFYFVLVTASFVVFASPLLTYMLGDSNFAFEALVIGFVNIHHYFIDGAIWKIRNPAVRRDLFAHLSPSS